jgi:hypothetical protein
MKFERFLDENDPRRIELAKNGVGHFQTAGN